MPFFLSSFSQPAQYSPGYSNYQSNAQASYGTHSGYASGKANGYSVGPSISTINRPWGVFSAWVYSPSLLGIRMDDDHNILGFHLNSDAEELGIRVGDILLGVDDYDVLDQKVIEHFMTIQPCEKIKVTIRRGSKKIDYNITALPN